MFIKSLLKVYVNSVCGSEVVGLEPFFMLQKGFINQSVGLHPVMSQFGLVVRHWAGKREDLNLILLWLSFFFKKVVVCGYNLMTLSITSC